MSRSARILRALAIALLLCLQPVMRGSASPADSFTAYPVDDATANAQHPDTTYDGLSLGVGGSGLAGSCTRTLVAYLKFDLTGLGTISTATLILRSTFATVGGSLNMGLFGSSDDSWSETSVTWNTAPALNPLQLSSASLTPAGEGVTFGSTADLVDFLETERQADGVATLGIAATACSFGSVTQQMSSKGGSVRPRLMLEAPTAVTLISLRATAEGDGIRLAWATASEIDLAGFNLWRSTASDGTYAKINAALIDALGGPTQPASYSFDDPNLAHGTLYFYKLEDVDTSGHGTFHGPVWAKAGMTHHKYLPILVR